MKTFKSFRLIIVLGGILLSACAGAPAGQAIPAAGSAGGDKPLSELVFTGVLEEINADQWMISGQTVSVDSSVLRDGPFVVGDTLKVEAVVADDGSVTVQRIEPLSLTDPMQAATGTPEAVSTPASPDASINEREAFGTVESMTSSSITVDGQTYFFVPGAEIKGDVVVGATVKLHILTNSDGTFSVREIETAVTTQNNATSSPDDNSNGTTVTDDNSPGNDDSATDDHGNGGSSSDDSSDDKSVDSNDDPSNDGSGHG